jgi:hypothetical protein
MPYRPDNFEEVEPLRDAPDIARLSCSEALRNTGRKLVLFTPALMITHGRFDRDPVIEYDCRFPVDNADLRPFVVDLQKDSERFFEGLGVSVPPGKKKPVNWDKRIYALDASRADECFGFIGGIAFSDPKRGYFGTVLSYDLDIPDPTSRIHERLEVKVFGVLANNVMAFLAPRPHNIPVVQVVHNPGHAWPTNLPRTNLLGVPLEEDILGMREED